MPVIKAAFLLITIIISLFQITLLDYFNIFGVKPDLLFICAVIASLSFEYKWALAFIVLAGILKDGIGVLGFGINTMLFSLWGYLIIKLSRKITLENDLLPAVLIFVIMVINDITVRIIFFSFTNLTIPLGIFLRITFLESAYTAVIFPFVFRAVRYLLMAVKSYSCKFLKTSENR